MTIIGFAKNTSKCLPRILCGQFKHCALITQHNDKFVLHQFVKRKCIRRITITERGLTQLESNGWVFIYTKLPIQSFNQNAWTCVSYVKHAVGTHNFLIQTPNGLYKYLQKNLQKNLT